MLLPTVERRGDIHFSIAKRLPYRARLGMAFALLAAGLTVEAVLLDTFFWAGLPLVLAGVLLLVTRGYENKPAVLTGTEDWRPAQTKEVERIIEIDRMQTKWDQDAVDATCGLGVLVLLLLSAGVAGAAFRFARSAPLAVPFIVANSVVMLLPFWVTGVRSILKNDRLVVKLNTLRDIQKTYSAMTPHEGEEFQYQLQTVDAPGEGKRVPRDAKAILVFHHVANQFLGVQMQVAINSVQGKDYPYFYCVLVARPEFGLLDRDLAAPPKNIAVEAKHEGGVDIVVIRQKTTKTSGYHTKSEAARRIAAFAISETRRLLSA